MYINLSSNNRKPKLADIKHILNLYEDGVHGSPESIIMKTNFKALYVYRIIYWYRVNQIPVNKIPDFILRTYIKPIPHMKGTYN